MILLTTWSFGQRAGRAAWAALREGGAALDAVEATCVAAELDEKIDSVGYGGLPDAEGEVTLDGCVMLSPRRCGSVCCLRQVRHPVTAARRVMEGTDHVMLAGEAADRFALEAGLSRAPLRAPAAEAAWREWLENPRVVDQGRDARLLRPIDRGPGSGGALFDRGVPDPNRHHDTIGVLAIDGRGVLAGACSTSGTPFKTPGRVGDSPIIGHGLYVDPDVGAATATGAGELIMGVCGAFLVVELMRQGRAPIDASRAVLERIAGQGPLEPHHQVALIALRKDGTWAAGALRSGYRTSCFRGGGDAGGEVVEPDVELLPDR